jgi:hypothetical protein
MAPLLLVDSTRPSAILTIPGSEEIDALPYVDPLTPEDKATVDKLIAEEVR